MVFPLSALIPAPVRINVMDESDIVGYNSLLLAYNRLILRKQAVISVLVIALSWVAAPAAGPQPDAARTSHILLIMPFDNVSNVPGLDWIGEAFPEVLSNRMNSASL